MVDHTLKDLMTLLSIPGPPAQEGKVAAFMRERLLEMDVPADHIQHDATQQQSEYGGEVGNLIVRLDGQIPGPHLMFSTHLDTVPNAVGCQPRLDPANQRIVNDAPDTALGGDNRTGCAVLLNLVRALQSLEGNHPPLTLVFFVQEEVGLVGARGLDLSMLGESLPAMCFNLDGRHVEKVVTAVIGSERFTIDITGIAAHAGSSPTDGVSAAIIAANALAELERTGWHGRIDQPAGRGTANVGIMRGGQGSNVVMPDLHILAEARSHDAVFRQEIIKRWQTVFQHATQQTTNQYGQSGSATFGPGPIYEAFALTKDAPVVQRTVQAAQECNIEVELVSNDGGMDANWIVAHGIPTVTISPGQREIHTVQEWIDLADFAKACELIVMIATMEAT